MKICFFTGTRAEYGLLKPLIIAVKNDPELTCCTIASDALLSSGSGMTVSETGNDGIEITEKVEMLLGSDSDTAVCKSIGLGLMGFGESLSRIRPDLLVVSGDRYDVLAVASAAIICRIPILHINGGESSEGLIDEQIRHAVTKMSHLHFTSTEFYRHRIIQMGEEPSVVINTGAIGISDIRSIEIVKAEDIYRFFGFSMKKPLALVSLRPVPSEPFMAEDHFNVLSETLFAMKDIQVVFTKAMADSEGRIINDLIDEAVKKYPERARGYHSLDRAKYLGAVKASTFVIGNSSSGIMEVPSFGVPTINIGNRQKGRVRAESVIDCAPDVNSISTAISLALLPGFRIMASRMENPYEKRDTIKIMVDEIKKAGTRNLLMKSFHDMY